MLESEIMIDTDKYEGHTPAPWEWVIPEWGDDHIHDSEGNIIAQVTNIDEMQMNAQLIADAPKLLAEVKRLREQQKQIHDLLAKVLPRKDGMPQMGVMLWGIESELKRVVGKVAIILGMAESEEE